MFYISQLISPTLSLEFTIQAMNLRISASMNCKGFIGRHVMMGKSLFTTNLIHESRYSDFKSFSLFFLQLLENPMNNSLITIEFSFAHVFRRFFSQD